MNEFINRYLLYYPATLLKGEPVFQCLRKARKFQFLSRAEIEKYQLIKLKTIVNHAYGKSSFYRQLYDKSEFSPSSLRSLQDIKRLPLLTKAELASRLPELETGGLEIFRSRKTTGGSTGQAVSLFKNASALANERAVTARSYEWAGISVGSPQARFWGVPLSDINKVRSRIIDLIANRKRFSAFAVTDSELGSYYQEIRRFQPHYIYGYVSSIVDFARFVDSRGLVLPASIKAVITTSEVLTAHTRRELSRLLNLPIFNEYGCGEVGSVAHECEKGSLHVMEDNVILEIVDQDGAHSSSGEIVVTDLSNLATPLIRYRLGDFASYGTQCTCGRLLVTLENVHGRAYDQIVTSAGKRYHPEIVMYIFEKIKDEFGGISQFQVIQKSTKEIIIFIVRATDFKASLEKTICSDISAQIGCGIDVKFEYVESIPREASGKIRLVKSFVGRAT